MYATLHPKLVKMSEYTEPCDENIVNPGEEDDEPGVDKSLKHGKSDKEAVEFCRV